MNKAFWKRMLEGFKILCIIAAACFVLGLAAVTCIAVGLIIIYSIVKFVPVGITTALAIIITILCLSYKLGEK